MSKIKCDKCTLSPGYKMRIARLEGYDELIKSLVEVPDYEKILGVSHNGNIKDPNPHVHLVIFTQVKEKAFRKRMTSLFTKGKGNGHVSSPPLHDLSGCEPLSYMFHEEDNITAANIIVNKGFSVDDIAHYQSMNNEIQEVIKKKKEKGGENYWEIIEEVKSQLDYVECLDTMTDYTTYTKRIASFDNMYRVLMRTLAKYRVRTSENDLNRWITTILRDDPHYGAGMRDNLKARFTRYLSTT